MRGVRESGLWLAGCLSISWLRLSMRPTGVSVSLGTKTSAPIGQAIECVTPLFVCHPRPGYDTANAQTATKHQDYKTDRLEQILAGELKTE